MAYDVQPDGSVAGGRVLFDMTPLVKIRPRPPRRPQGRPAGPHLRHRPRRRPGLHPRRHPPRHDPHRRPHRQLRLRRRRLHPLHHRQRHALPHPPDHPRPGLLTVGLAFSLGVRHTVLTRRPDTVRHTLTRDSHAWTGSPPTRLPRSRAVSPQASTPPAHHARRQPWPRRRDTGTDGRPIGEDATSAPVAPHHLPPEVVLGRQVVVRPAHEGQVAGRVVAAAAEGLPVVELEVVAFGAASARPCHGRCTDRRRASRRLASRLRGCGGTSGACRSPARLLRGVFVLAKRFASSRSSFSATASSRIAREVTVRHRRAHEGLETFQHVSQLARTAVNWHAEAPGRDRFDPGGRSGTGEMGPFRASSGRCSCARLQAPDGRRSRHRRLRRCSGAGDGRRAGIRSQAGASNFVCTMREPPHDHGRPGRGSSSATISSIRLLGWWLARSRSLVSVRGCQHARQEGDAAEVEPAVSSIVRSTGVLRDARATGMRSQASDSERWRTSVHQANIEDAASRA